MSNIYKLLTNRTEHLRYWLLLFQISVPLFSDICQLRLRYLSVLSQISVSCKLDIIKKHNL